MVARRHAVFQLAAKSSSTLACSLLFAHFIVLLHAGNHSNYLQTSDHELCMSADNLKLNFPAAFAASVLAWGLLEFPDVRPSSCSFVHAYTVSMFTNLQQNLQKGLVDTCHG